MTIDQTIQGDGGGRRQGRFFYLFMAQLALLVFFPYLDKPGIPTVIFRLIGVAIFLAGVYAVSDKRVQWITGLALAAGAGGLYTLYVFQQDSRIAAPTMIITILFLTFTLVSLLRAVLRDEKVTRETIYGALSVYLLMAFTWGAAYLLVSTLQPGAFSLDAARHANQAMGWSDCMFFSFVTLTTVGYGDIVPLTAPARSLSILEAISGTFYVAVLVARFVGIIAVLKHDAISRQSDSAGKNWN